MAQTLIHLSAPDNVRVNAEAPVELSFLALATCRRPQVQILLLRRPAESHNSARENNLTGESKCHLRQRLRSSPAAHWGLDLLYRQTWPAAASLSLSLMRRTRLWRQTDCGKRAIMPSG